MSTNMRVFQISKTLLNGHQILNSSFRNQIRFLTFTSQHDQLRETAKKIIEKDINPYIDKWEEQGGFPAHEVFKKLGSAGLLGITRDPEYNGLGLDYSYNVAFLEELSNINAGGVQTAIAVQADMAIPALARFGSDELKRNYLAPALGGDYVACLGVSEITGGSDVAALKTTAKRVGDDLVINGMKMWITNGAQADFMVMLANTSEGHVHRNKSLIVVPMNTPGVNVARKISKLGLHSSDTAEIYFDNVRVPAKHVIGEEGMGFIYQMMQFQDERLSCGITSVKMIEKIINGTIEYCRERHTFGQPLIDNQVIHFRLAEMQADVECLRSLVYRAADGMIEGEDVTYLASIAKLKAGRLSRQVVDQCLQYFGGMGYTSEMPISRAFRDARVMSIAGGTDEIMLGIISGMMGILPRKKKPKVAESQ